jgi:hypothetical protein
MANSFKYGFTTDGVESVAEKKFQQAKSGWYSPQCIDESRVLLHASVARGTPKPSWVGRKRSVIFAVTALHADFATRRRNVFPTAIGRVLPSFLFRAQSEAGLYSGRNATSCRHRLANSLRRTCWHSPFHITGHPLTHSSSLSGAADAGHLDHRQTLEQRTRQLQEGRTPANIESNC